MLDLSKLSHAGCYYDDAAAAKVRRFLESLVLTKSTKSRRPERWRLLPPHRQMVDTLFGWKREEDNTRQYRTCYFSVARKNAKTEIAAGVSLTLLFAEQDEPEIYLAAKDRDQASICYRACASLIKASGLSHLVDETPSQKEIRYKGGVLKAISSEGASKHGYNPSGVVVDELHAWGPPEQELWDALTSGSGARQQPLTLIITTAGVSELSICGQEYGYACQVRDEVIEDPSYLPLIYEIPKDADWKDESLWPLANPTLGDIVRIDYLREKLRKALKTPSEQVKFRRLHCNQWVNSETPWLGLDLWDLCEWDGKPFVEVVS